MSGKHIQFPEWNIQFPSRIEEYAQFLLDGYSE